MFARLDRWALNSFGTFNPFANLGGLAIANILIAIISGVALLPFYTVNMHEAYQSVSDMLHQGGGWLGIIHSLHRYSSDMAMFLSIMHLIRIFLNRAFHGGRVFSWETGVLSFFFLWLIGWTGYWLVWDQVGLMVAQLSAKLLDSIPIFGTFLGRGLLIDDPVNNQIFFVVFFIHMLIPLALFVSLWVHVFRVNRPRFLVSLKVFWILMAGLILFSRVFPAFLDVQADPLAIVKSVRGDFFFALPIIFLHTMPIWQVWLLMALGTGIFFGIPWIIPEKKRPPSFVANTCVGCGNCAIDCPYQAIEMLPRTDGARFETIAWIDPIKCMACGICNGTCDSSSNNLPGLPIQLIDSRISKWAEENKAASKSEWLLMVCQEISEGKLVNSVEDGRSSLLPGFRVIEVVCSGQVNPSSLKTALQKGFSGIIVGTSLPGSCSYREGDSWIMQRVKGERKPFGRLGTTDRTKIHFVQAGHPGSEELLREIRQLMSKHEGVTR